MASQQPQVQTSSQYSVFREDVLVSPGQLPHNLQLSRTGQRSVHWAKADLRPFSRSNSYMRTTSLRGPDGDEA